MCTTCGCGGDGAVLEAHPHHSHDHDHHGHGHGHDHLHGPAPADGRAARLLAVEQDLLARNDAHAADNRQYFHDHGLFTVNLVSSPGSGKTTLLVASIAALAGTPLGVIEGDQQTSVDADRIRATGAPAVQINTGRGCHLDAHMVGHALERLRGLEDGILFIENVGNLVCPAPFDLGEATRVVVLSVTEGDDKPLKYPDMFASARLMLLNKADLLPHVDFDPVRCLENARRVNPDLKCLTVSATSGEGMAKWVAWLRAGLGATLEARQRDNASLRRQLAAMQAELARLRAGG